ncbi:MAG: PBP1A family penicillin-binding protein [Desulfomonilaceae bacterium]|nr:PBP1A family penicillin-binding protein [Desulfomonilaceae bacterium]
MPGLIVWFAAGLPVLVLCALGSAILGALIGGYLAFSAGLPDIPDLRRYRPKTVSTFYAQDGTVIGIFYREKRFPVALDSLPPHVVNAFLAAEDARFFSHAGVDMVGIARASIKNVVTGTFAQGGSTITQQVTRNFILTREKKLSRKIREMILSFRLEQTLGKKEILQLYLNEIYLGKGAYGIEAAARIYFGKTSGELTVAEAALIAGLVSNPSKYAPHRNADAALSRRTFVLDGMLRNNFISEDQYRSAIADTPDFRESLPNTYQRAPYFAEAVRQYIVAKYGEDRLYNDGLTVWTTCDLSLQRKASKALIKGVRSWEQRRGRPAGLVRRLKATETRALLADPAPDSFEVGDVVEAVVLENKTPKKRKREKEDRGLQECLLALRGGARFTMPLAGNVHYRPNDLLHFTIARIDDSRVSLEPVTLPPVQGAVVCIENRTGYVRALVGGTKFQRSSFNRALQARRQPGSAFKPFVYTAALEWGHYGPQTLVVDEPIAVEVNPAEPEWIPSNSDGSFHGPINLRQALANSRNIAAVKLIMDVGIDRTIRMAGNMGIQSPLGKNLSLCLGASEVTPLELTSAYTVFPNMGLRVDSVLVKKVVDRFGNVLEDNSMEPLNIDGITAESASASPRYLPYGARQPAADRHGSSTALSPAEPRQVTQPVRGHGASVGIESVLSRSFPSEAVTSRGPVRRVLSSQTAYLMTSMLRQVCTSGTASTVSRLGRKDLAGKTGTTDECTDAWFVGFNPRYTTGVWVGYDTKTSLGPKEYGNVAALPVWMEFMKDVLHDSPSQGYPVPPGIVFWELNMPIVSAGPDDLLHGGPDVPPGFDPKPVCPVDAGTVPSMHQASPFAGVQVESPVHMGSMNAFPTPVAFGSGFYPGMVRVLSPTGETLGHGYPTSDTKGQTKLFRNDYTYFQQHPWAQESTEPPVSGAMGAHPPPAETPRQFSHDPVMNGRPGPGPSWYEHGWNY